MVKDAIGYCSYTGEPLYDTSDGIWDDGEWIGWGWLNQQIYLNDLREKYPDADIDLVEMFENLVEQSKRYFEVTNRHLPIFGELGEIFAEITFGIKRHKMYAQGSDGKLGNDFVEIKTISPIKNSYKVSVKRAGNFSKLIIVKISENFEFEAQLIDRKNLPKSESKIIRVKWRAGADKSSD